MTIHSQNGFSIVEVILASSVFALIVVTFTGAFLYGQEATVLSGQRMRATFIAEEGLEAVRNIRDENFDNLTDGTFGLAISGNQWLFSGSQDMVDIFTRHITITSVDARTKQIDAHVVWQQNEQRTGTVTLTAYLTHWQAVAGVPQADSLIVNTSSADIDPSDTTKVMGVTMENTGTSDILLNQMSISWTGAHAGTKMQEISIDNTIVWSGNDSSGSTFDITDFNVVSGSGAYLINYFDFNKDMSLSTITVTFIMSDGTTKQEIFTPGASSDTTAPSAITDIILSNPTPYSMNLSWTAPGDDGNTGTAKSYDVRYSTSLITEINWASATQVIEEPIPSGAGSRESMTISGLLPHTNYYFAIKTSDEVPNVSRLSNVPNASTLPLSSNQALNLSVDTSSIGLSNKNKDLTGITMNNTGASDIVLDKITVSWTGVGGTTKIQEISIDNAVVWSGNNGSGNIVDINNVILTSGASIHLIDYLKFSKSISGATLEITFTMSDGSFKTLSNIIL